MILFCLKDNTINSCYSCPDRKRDCEYMKVKHSKRYERESQHIHDSGLSMGEVNGLKVIIRGYEKNKDGKIFAEVEYICGLKSKVSVNNLKVLENWRYVISYLVPEL